MTGIKVKDTQTGLRCIPYKYVGELLNVEGERYEYETNVLIYAKQNEVKLEEVEIETIYIENNKHSHFNPLKDSFKIYMVLLKYISSSLISFLIDILSYKLFFNLLISISKMYTILISTFLARVISSIVNYKINKNIVFKKMNSKSKIRYFILCSIQLLISGAMVTYLYSLVGKYEVYLKILVDFIIFIINYKVQQEWVFKEKKN